MWWRKIQRGKYEANRFDSVAGESTFIATYRIAQKVRRWTQETNPVCEWEVTRDGYAGVAFTSQTLREAKWWAEHDDSEPGTWTPTEMHGECGECGKPPLIGDFLCSECRGKREAAKLSVELVA